MFPVERARASLTAAVLGALLVGLLPASVLAVVPLAGDDHVSVPVNAPATTIDVLAGDTGAPLTVLSATDPAHGTVVVAGNALSVTYQPDNGFHGTDTFDYTISDGDTTDVGAVLVDVNSPPVAVDDPNLTCQPFTFGGAFPLVEDWVSPTPPPNDYFLLFASCALLHNDTDVDGDTLTWEIVSQPAHGDAIKVNEEFFGYKADPDYSASDDGLPATDFDSFTYRAFDGYAYSQQATMRFWVAPINDAPTFTAGAPQVVVGENSGAYSAPWASYISPGPESELWQVVHFEADTPPNGVPNLFASPPAIDLNGILTFTPNPDEVGLVHVTVRAKDDGGLEDWGVGSSTVPDDTSADVTFDIVVVPVAVSAVDDPFVTLPEDPTEPWQIDVLGNDTFPGGSTITAVTQGTLGLVTIAPDGLSVFYAPDPDANGNDSFTYTLDDGEGSVDTATVDVTITPFNDNPVIGDDSLTVRVNGAAKAVDVLADDTDVEGDTLLVTETSASLKGTVTITGGGTGVTYQPDTDESGSDSFTYTVSDGHGGTGTGTVAVTIADNIPPAAADDALTVLEDADATAVDVLDDDTDADDDPLVITATSTPGKGTVVITGDGAGLTYEPNANANGADSFTYTIDDEHGGTDTATVHVTITPDNDAPVATDDTLTIAEDAVATVVAVLGNDSDVDDDARTITGKTNGAKGVVVITGAGTGLTYEPSLNANGSDSFTYTIDDGHGATDTATVNVTITPGNDSPVATDDTLTITEDAVATAVTVLGNDSDPDGDPRTITAKTDGTKGTVAITGGGTGLTYEPDPNANGSDSFTYTIDDGHGATDVATVTVTITPDNDAPVATNDTLTVTEEAAATAVPVLGNDTDVDGDTRTITAKTDGAKGAVVITGGGTGLTYKPNANANGSDSFTYTIDDGHGATDVGTVIVTITPVNDKPDARNDTAFAVQQGAGSTGLPVLTNDTDADLDALNITAKTNGAHGVVAITGGGTGLTYNPAGLYFGTDVFTYTVSDGHGGTDTATVLMTVVKDNQKPVTTAPVGTFYNQTAGSSSTKIRLNWSGIDTGGTGIASYKLQVSANGGSYSTISLSSATATSSTRTLAVNGTYRYRVRATDKGGNVGAYVYGPAFKLVRVQNNSAALTYVGRWTTSSNAKALGGSHRYTSTAGASVTYTGSMREIGWIATKTATSGSAQVWVDGTLAATINLRSSSTGYRKLVFHRHFAAGGTHTVEIRSLGGGRVYLDALAILR